jgi:hypothetical protein
MLRSLNNTNNNNNNNKAYVHVGIFWNTLIPIILRKVTLGASTVLVTPSVCSHGYDVSNYKTRAEFLSKNITTRNDDIFVLLHCCQSGFVAAELRVTLPEEFIATAVTF